MSSTPCARVDALVRDLEDLVAVPYTDSRIGDVVTVADLRLLLSRHRTQEAAPPR